MKTDRLKRLLGALLLLAAIGAKAQSYGEIRGIIKDSAFEPVPFATVKVLQGTRLVGGTQSDMDGRYSYKPLTPGTYELMVMEPGHVTQPVNKIKVIPNEATYVDVKLAVNSFTEIVVVAKPIDYLPTGVDKTMGIVKSFDAVELKQNAGYNPGDIKGALSSLTSEALEVNGAVHFRGARGDASGYFVDGVRTLYEAMVPGTAIENLTVLSGGVPAMYGDLTSGVVVITTKSYFSGIREKNVRDAEFREQKRAEQARKKALEEEKNRQEEIRKEKAKERQE